MKLIPYIKDKIIELIIITFTQIIIILLLLSFKVEQSLIIAINITYIIMHTLIITIDYTKKRTFYNNLNNNIKHLDKAYLVLETIEEPNFYEGKLTYNSLYDINKSMIENINTYECQVDDFKNYVEMWIHEIKIPLSSLALIAHNNKNKIPKSALIQIKKLDDYLEQILYYTRSENANKDYCINKINLGKSINNTLLKNKDYLLDNNINIKVENINYEIYSDSKWLEFILNQIINNSIKYKNTKTESYIKIKATKNKENITLIIEDNGLGINASDLPRVFEKTFTGENGRKSSKSTGMGLFIVKNLCIKLGHQIYIESEYNKYTKVYIKMPINKYYEVVK